MELVIPVDGGHLWADDTGGDGPVLVLLHSGWGDSSIWLPMLNVMPSRFRVIRYDARGYGRSPASEAPFSQFDDLIAVLDHCGVADAVIVGYSGSGGTALSLALADPGRVRALLLLAPGVSDYPWPMEDPYFAEFGALLAAGDREGLVTLGLRTWAAAGSDDAAQEQVGRAVATFSGMDEAMMRPDPPAYGRLAEITVPVTMVIGDRDYPMMIRCARDVAARIPGCHEVVVPGADHMLPLRAPALVAGLLAG